MGRKIPAKKHRGVKDPLLQQVKRLERFVCLQITCVAHLIVIKTNHQFKRKNKCTAERSRRAADAPLAPKTVWAARS